MLSLSTHVAMWYVCIGCAAVLCCVFFVCIFYLMLLFRCLGGVLVRVPTAHARLTNQHTHNTPFWPRQVRSSSTDSEPPADWSWRGETPLARVHQNIGLLFIAAAPRDAYRLPPAPSPIAYHPQPRISSPHPAFVPNQPTIHTTSCSCLNIVQCYTLYILTILYIVYLESGACSAAQWWMIWSDFHFSRRLWGLFWLAFFAY